MAQNKGVLCKYCQAPLYDASGEDEILCPYCYHTNKLVYDTESEQKALEKAAEYRYMGEFEEAAKLYQGMSGSGSDAGELMARWGKLLCKYGVVYEERQDGDERVITCRKSLVPGFQSEYDFTWVLNHAPAEEREQFLKDGAYIDEVQRKIQEQKSRPAFEIFISYKQSDGKGGETEDSIDAARLYKKLKADGYNVFYAPKTLKGFAGTSYEAVIFHAIETSRVMVVYGSREEYITSTWVKSEWTRFLSQMKKNPAKRLITMYVSKRNRMFQLPEELSKLQNINATGDEDFTELMKQIHNLLPKKNKEAEKAVITAKETEEGDRLLAQGELMQAIRSYQRAASLRDRRALYKLGDLYYCGWDEGGETLEPDVKRAFDCYRKAAELGEPEAIYQVAFMYEVGIGCDADGNKALEWYEKARLAGCDKVPEEF